jgi:hypothetical protein
MMFYLLHQNQKLSILCELVPADKGEALASGLKFGFGALGLTLLTIFIPIVHFVSVPLGLIFSPIIGFAVYKIYSMSQQLSGSFQCPSCQSPQKFLVEKTGNTLLMCKQCNHDFPLYEE